ncbi:TIGR03943 family putative permease subunit [Streptomyces xantholiticus]|uniref:TIGR03943 family putative permease subunit n=1 Tax=Streptomyces xantholiticus TaxID=68285 RepID=UPI00167573C8|nr:TIGR03943 family protein [Streptomyces xantholiticus]GGW65799.1 membrane protein [Streptomyces xantholiticus]
MRTRFQALCLVLTGVALLRICLFSDLYLRYVKAGLQPLLVASGAVLVALGTLTAAHEMRSRRRPRTGDMPHDERPPADGDGHGHDHTRGPRIGWLLYIPAIMLLLFAPPALGAYTAARDDALAASPAGSFPTLPETEPLPLSVRAFSSRAVYDTGDSLRGRTVTLTGFVTPDGHGGWYLSRLLIRCCAADAGVLKVAVYGAKPPPADTWVTVEGVWHPTGPAGGERTTPALDATAVSPIPEPADPYTDTPRAGNNG